MRYVLLFIAVFCTACGVSLPDRSGSTLHLDRFELPDGFRGAVFADQLPEARSLARSEVGTIFVGMRDGSGRTIVARGVRNAVGFDWHPETGHL